MNKKNLLYNGWRLTVVDPADFASYCAQLLHAHLSENPHAVLGLSTGRTTGDIHRRLATMVTSRRTDISGAYFFGLDEVTGVSVDYPGSCVWMLLHECITEMGVAPERFLMLPTQSDDWERDCAAFAASLRSAGGISLLELGLGENGHIGFNSPGTPFDSRCFHGKMDEALEKRVRAETNSPSDAPLGGVTLGIADVMESRRILLCVNGKNKRAVLRELLDGSRTTALPASILKSHPNITIICDTDAYSQDDTGE